ncbi:unnamed protein product [Eruca vesicaria subsp. sativa]|uniref:Uncharacterized protein n=1 Tax=Eruca vesicaria subsp. sativa TaxID=29727 RepID=A0ABC8M240_ERUVS|nr:unnamed protein product [Eruca vesicaria subsp. sativa]
MPVVLLELKDCLQQYVWDKKMVHKQFNWLWHHVPTFAPYKVEGVFLTIQGSCTGKHSSNR